MRGADTFTESISACVSRQVMVRGLKMVDRLCVGHNRPQRHAHANPGENPSSRFVRGTALVAKESLQKSS